MVSPIVGDSPFDGLVVNDGANSTIFFVLPARLIPNVQVYDGLDNKLVDSHMTVRDNQRMAFPGIKRNNRSCQEAPSRGLLAQ